MTSKRLPGNAKTRTGWCHYIQAKSTKKDRAHWFDVKYGIAKSPCGITLPVRMVHMPMEVMPLKSLLNLCSNCVKAQDRWHREHRAKDKRRKHNDR